MNLKLKKTYSVPLFVSVIFILCLAERYMRERIMATDGNKNLTVIILQIIIFIIPAVIFCRIKSAGYYKYLNIRVFSPAKLGAVIVAACVLIVGSALIRFAQFNIKEFAEPTFSFLSAYYTPYEDGRDVLMAAMSFVVTPAICEELVFRGIILSEYNGTPADGKGNKERYDAVNASLISVLLFALLPMNVELLPINLMSGTVYCMLMYATGSSIAPFITHLLFSTYSVFGEKYVFNAIKNPANFEMSLTIFGILFFFFLCWLFLLLSRMLRKTANGDSLRPVQTPSYLLEVTDDDTPDVSSTDTSMGGKKNKGLSRHVKGLIDIIVSPTLVLCVILFFVGIFELS